MANDEIHASGRTVDDAVQRALKRLGLSRAQVEVEVISEGRSGIFGIGNANAAVRVWPREGATPRPQQTRERAPLPRIDDYEDPQELEPGQRSDRRGGQRAGQRSGQRGGQRSGQRDSQRRDAAPRDSDRRDSDQRAAPRAGQGDAAPQPDHRRRGRSHGREIMNRPQERREAPDVGARSAPSGPGRVRSRDDGDRGRGRNRARDAERDAERDRERDRDRDRGGDFDSPGERPEPRPPIAPFELMADPDFEPASDPREFASELLTDIIHLLGFDTLVEARDPETPMDGLNHSIAVLDVKPKAGDELGLLIGRHGSHIAALQYIVNVILSHALDGNNPITVDIDGYKRRREEALEEIAQRTTAEVREYGDAVELSPMPAAERRIIHLAVQEDPELTTESVGDGPTRRVRIVYREGA